MPVIRDTTLAMSSGVTASWMREFASVLPTSPSAGSFCSKVGMTPNRSSDALPKFPSRCACSSSNLALSSSSWTLLTESISALSFSQRALSSAISSLSFSRSFSSFCRLSLLATSLSLRRYVRSKGTVLPLFQRCRPPPTWPVHRRKPVYARASRHVPWLALEHTCASFERLAISSRYVGD